MKTCAQITLAILTLIIAFIVCCVLAVGRAVKLVGELAVEFFREARRTELRDFFHGDRT